MFRLDPKRLTVLTAAIALLANALPHAAAQEPDHAAITAQHLATLRVAERDPKITALHALWHHVDDTDLPALHEALATEGSRVRWRVARLLGVLADESSVQPLAERLASDPDPFVRWASAHTLGLLPTTAASDALEAALRNDADATVKMRAAWSLAQVDVEAAEVIAEYADTLSAGALSYFLDWVLQSHEQGPSFLPSLTPGVVGTGALGRTKYLVYVSTRFAETQTRRPEAPLVLAAIHGSEGQPNLYIDICKEEAERAGLVLIAPYFDQGVWPNFDNCNLVNQGINTVRADLRLLEIVDVVRDALSIQSERVHLYGHSRGGQLVQRFIYAHPQHVARSVAAGNGLYLQWDDQTMFPFGTEANPFAPEVAGGAFGAFVQAPWVVVMGTEDLQGRIDETTRFLEQVEAFEAAHDVEAAVELLWVEGGGHLGESNWPTAAEYILAGASGDIHTADVDASGELSLGEVLRVAQLYNTGAYHCSATSEDGYAPGAGDLGCAPHDADWQGGEGVIGLTELLRVIQLFSSGGYHACDSATEDGWCAGASPAAS